MVLVEQAEGSLGRHDLVDNVNEGEEERHEIGVAAHGLGEEADDPSVASCTEGI
jgi:hypothetical protein